MSRYQSIKNFGKKALLVAGLVAVLSGYPKKAQCKTAQNFAGVNIDGIKYYLREFYPRKAPWAGSDVPDYELVVAERQQDGTLRDAKSVMQFGSEKPLEVRLEDLNDDGYLDLVYLRKFYPRKAPWAGSDVPDYELMVAEGQQDATLGDAKSVMQFGSEEPLGVILVDLNWDGNLDLVYLREVYPRKAPWAGSDVPDYELMVIEGQQDDTLGDAKSVMQFGSEKPLEITLEDLNGDGNLDLVYLREFYPRKVPWAGSDVPDYELRVANGNGDGTFGNPIVIESYGSD